MHCTSTSSLAHLVHAFWASSTSREVGCPMKKGPTWKCIVDAVLANDTRCSIQESLLHFRDRQRPTQVEAREQAFDEAPLGVPMPNFTRCAWQP